MINTLKRLVIWMKVVPEFRANDQIPNSLISLINGISLLNNRSARMR